MFGTTNTSTTKNKRRFNLLMLEENEYYFIDYGGFHHRNEGDQIFMLREKSKGRFHICSKSIIFDPDDQRQPVLR
jgi:hypothetical protein